MPGPSLDIQKYGCQIYKCLSGCHQECESCAGTEQNNSLCRVASISGNLMGVLSGYHHQMHRVGKDKSIYKINNISEEIEF